MTTREPHQLPKNMTIDIGDLRVDFIGDAAFLTMKDADESPLHIHTVHEFQYIHAGVLHELIDEERILDVAEGEILFIPPNVLHRNTAGTCQRLAMAITIQQIHRETDESDFSEFGYYCELLGKIREPVVFRDREILECVKALIELSDGKQSIHKKKVLLTRIFIRLAECMDALSMRSTLNLPIRQGSRSDRQYYLIEQHINTRYTQKTSVDEIAQILHVSRRQADRIVKQIFGKTYAELIRQRRMSIARTMIQKTDVKCTQIAEQVGYSTYTGFFIAFREHFGCTPEEMRQAKRGG